MTDNRTGTRSTGNDPVVIDSTVPHPSRIYDYLLGVTDNFEVDRAAAQRAGDDVGGMENARHDIRSNRSFLGWAVRHLAGDLGVRQFLDLGTGIPNADNVHGVAQSVAPDARIVYVDNDPVVLAQSHNLLNSTAEGATAYLDGDLRDPQGVLQAASATLDFGRTTGPTTTAGPPRPRAGRRPTTWASAASPDPPRSALRRRDPPAP